MANYRQLTRLTPEERTALRALEQVRVAEIVQITWPAPDGVINYAWWQLDDDPAYASTITTWLDGNPLVVAFTADEQNDDVESPYRFHPIVNTAAISDDVVTFKFSNIAQEFAKLCYKHRGGVRVEVFYHYPQLNKTTSEWHGHLRTPDEVSADFVSITAANGFRSADALVPTITHANCEFPFGGAMPPELRADNPCNYDPANGQGELNPETGEPFPTCPDHSKANCIERWGPTLMRTKYGGIDSAVQGVPVGLGDHTTLSRTQGSATISDAPARRIYGKRKVKNLYLLDYRPEFNPSPKHQDKGTLVTQFEVSLGRVKSITNVKVLDSELPRQDGRGLEVRLGARDQAPTGFTDKVLGYNKRALFRGDRNPINPAGYKKNNITAECDCEGADEVRIYTDAETFTTGYTQERAWGFLDVLTSPWFGHRMDATRLHIPDFIHAAGIGSPFNADLQGKTIRQHAEDICLPAYYRLFNFNGVTRLLVREPVDFEAGDIPLFTDRGSQPNILWDDERGTSWLDVDYDDFDKIPAKVVITLEDAENENVERPLTFVDERVQYAEGERYGDTSARSDVRPYAAIGLTTEAEVRPLGFQLLNLGPFEDGGLANNCRVTLRLYAHDPDAIDLHLNKIIEVDSAKLDEVAYADPQGNPYRYFRVTRLERDRGDVLSVKAQAYVEIETPPVTVPPCTPSVVQWADAVGWSVTELNGGLGALFPPYGDFLGEYTTLRVRSVQTLTLNGEHLDFQVNPNGAELYLGVTETRDDAGTPQTGPDRVEFNKPDWHFKIDRNAGTFDCVEPDGTVIFSNGALDGTLAIKRTGAREVTFAKYSGSSLNDLVSSTADHDLGPLYGCVVGGAVGSGNQPPSVVAASICLSANTGVTTGGGGATQTVADSQFVLVDNLWREQERAAGVPGLYVAAAPTTRAKPWGAFELHRDKGAGYAELLELTTEATLGSAVTVLAATELGTETVDVELLPEQTLPSYTAEQIAAGQGYYYLGGEIFQARTATQLDTDPNQWRLSNLSNRGAHCTAAFQATHATDEDFVALNPVNVIFVPLESSEIGVTRNFKGVTAGQSLTSVTARAFTFQAPNFLIETPADYAVSFDPVRLELAHDWTPVSGACLITTGLLYEIWNDASGSPGTLIWSGTPNQWRQAFNTAGTFTFHLRARTAFVTGAFVAVTVTVSFDTGTFAIEDLTGEFAVEDSGGEFAIEDE